MTAPKSNASLAAKFLRERVQVEGAPPSAEARDAAIIAIERAIAARNGRKRARMIIGITGACGVAAAASILLGLFGIPALRGSGAVASTSIPILAHPISANGASGAGATIVGANKADPSKAMPLSDGALVTRGQRVIAPADGKIVFAHVTGTELTLQAASEMSVVEDDQNRIYSLGKGTLDLHVAKLTANERLLVRTSDAEVEVRGTRFHVTVVDPATSCDGRSTRVSVDEGVVVVRRDGAEARLTAGQSWPDCSQTAITPPATNTAVSTASPTSPSATSTSTSAPTLTPSAATVATAGGTGGIASPPHAQSTLDKQNDLFAEGIDKKHQGDMAGAAAAFERLLALYPDGHLAESASAERFRVLRASNPARAKLAAREYLNHWPDGFARNDAESVLREAP